MLRGLNKKNALLFLKYYIGYVFFQHVASHLSTVLGFVCASSFEIKISHLISDSFSHHSEHEMNVKDVTVIKNMLQNKNTK